MASLDEIEDSILNNTDLRQRIVRSIGSSTIALFAISYVRGNERLKFVGTGTLAVAGKSHGILTAAHVWKVIKPEPKLGITMTDRIDHRYAIDLSTIVPTVLDGGESVPEESGPDLAFLRIPNELVAEIEAYHTFENLQRPIQKLGVESLESWWAIGAPSELGVFTEIHASLEIDGGHVDPKYLSGAPDYYEFEVDTQGPGIPSSYGGYSGGGLWRVPLYTSSTGKIDWGQRLVGVIFYQFPARDNRRVIRCHGPRTIASLLNLVDHNGTMRIRPEGREHQTGNSACPACEQRSVSGGPLSPVIRRYPYVDGSSNPPCGGLIHSETFGTEQTGWETIYVCDKCGGNA